MNLTLHGKRDFAGVIKSRILIWRDYPGLSRWALHAITSVLMRGSQRETWLQRGEDNVMMEAETGVIQVGDGRKGHRQRNTDA